MKKRSLGVRFLRITASGSPALPVITGQARALIELYDIDSGDAIDSVNNIQLSYSVEGVLEATVSKFLSNRTGHL